MDWDKGIAPLKGCMQSNPVNVAKPIDFTNLKDKVILITGGASGFGAGIAHKAAINGAHIIIGDINTKQGTEVVASLRGKSNDNPNHHFINLDVTSWSSQASFFKQAALLSPHGGIDVVIANAGIGDLAEGQRFERPPDYSKLPDDPPDPAVIRTLDVNLKGVFYTTHLALSYLPQNPGSTSCSTSTSASSPSKRDRQIILVSSMAGICAHPLFASYCASKHGVVGLFRSLRVTAPQFHGVRVNMINPYFSATPIIGAAGEMIMAGGELAKVEDVIDTFMRFMCDDTIVGRGLVVSPEGVDDEELRVVGLDKGNRGPVWDVYAHDWEQTDVFVRRIIAVTNLRVRAKGWIGLIGDVVGVIGKALGGLVGRS